MSACNARGINVSKTRVAEMRFDPVTENTREVVCPYCGATLAAMPKKDGAGWWVVTIPAHERASEPVQRKHEPSPRPGVFPRSTPISWDPDWWSER